MDDQKIEIKFYAQNYDLEMLNFNGQSAEFSFYIEAKQREYEMTSMIQNSMVTDRLILETLNAEDADFIKTLVNTKGWIENIGDRNIHSQNDAITYVHKILGTENLWYWVVRIKNTNGSIGIVSFMKRNYLDHFDIGFAFLPDFNNRGYAYEASKAVLSVVSAQPEYNIVLATTKSSNKSSIKLLTKLGFSFEKEMEVEKEKLRVYTNVKAFNAG